MKTVKILSMIVVLIISTYYGVAQETKFSFSVTEKNSDSIVARNGAELKLHDKFVNAIYDELSYKQLFSSPDFLTPDNSTKVKELIRKEITSSIEQDWNKKKCTLKGELNANLEILAEKIENEIANQTEGKAKVRIQVESPKVQSPQLEQPKTKPLTPEESKEAENLFIKALESQELGLNELALDYYQKGIAIESSLPQPFFNMGNAYYAIGNYDDAVKCYQKAITLKNDYPDAYYNMGNAYLDQKDFPQAIIAYQKAIEISPKESAIHYNLGIAYFENGDQDLAIAALQKAAQLGSSEAQIYLSSNGISW